MLGRNVNTIFANRCITVPVRYSTVRGTNIEGEYEFTITSAVWWAGRHGEGEWEAHEAFRSLPPSFLRIRR